MKKFMDENFLLNNDTAEKLYHNYAKDMPIFDYHCHLSPEEIYSDKRYNNITEVWLYGDHYKWRAMRANGIDEKYITGDGSDYEKFIAWAKTVPMTIGNPLYAWTHLELQRYFGIYETLDEKTAPMIWEKANKLIKEDSFSVRNLIKRSNVKVLCTTDDPADTLEYHIKLAEDKSFDVKVLPTFRPDKAINAADPAFKNWIEKLEVTSKKPISNFDDFLKVMDSRIEFFNEAGCRISDHALSCVPFESGTKEEIEKIFFKALNGESINKQEEDKYTSYMLYYLGKKYSELNWAMQIHIGALRNNNTRMFKKIGPDTGYDSVDDNNIAVKLSKLLDSMEAENKLPKVILYTLNPKDNYVLATMIGNYQSEIPGKIQFGSGWWFNDNKDGMIEQMKALSNCGLLSRFVGMLTDSRSFLSYTRHEYFRRVLCNFIGQLVENGEAPCDFELLGSMVQNISFNNAKNYFKI